MATLKDKMALATELFSRNDQPGENRVYGVATAASSGGSVTVNVGGETVTMPTVGAVRQGDEVIVQVQDSSPVAIGSRGWGDSVQEAIDEHSETLSYVWLDEYGRLRVTPEPREDNPTTGVTVSATGVDIVSQYSAMNVGSGGATVSVNGTDTLILGGNPSGGRLYGSPQVSFVAADSLSTAPSAATIAALHCDNLSQAGPIFTIVDMGGAFDLDLSRKQYTGDSGTASLSRVLDMRYGTGASAIVSDYIEADAIKLNGTWHTSLPHEMVVLSYGHSTWQDFIDAYNNNAVVYCRASSNANPGTGAQTRMAFMAYVNSDPPTNVEFQYYRSVSSHSATQQGDQVYIYKLTNAGTWSVTVREASVQVVADTGLTRTYTTNKITLGIDDTGWTNVATGIRARVVGKMMTVVAVGYTTDTTSGWATVGTLPASVTGGSVRFLACKYSDGTTRRGEIDGNTLKLHQPGTAIGVEFTVTVPVG